jgi:hypothetical protein
MGPQCGCVRDHRCSLSHDDGSQNTMTCRCTITHETNETAQVVSITINFSLSLSLSLSLSSVQRTTHIRKKASPKKKQHTSERFLENTVNPLACSLLPSGRPGKYEINKNQIVRRRRELVVWLDFLTDREMFIFPSISVARTFLRECQPISMIAHPRFIPETLISTTHGRPSAKFQSSASPL